MKRVTDPNYKRIVSCSPLNKVSKHADPSNVALVKKGGSMKK